MSPEEMEYIARTYNICPRCGRSVPPAEIDPLKLTDWLLKHDPWIRRAYDLGRHDEWERQDAENQQLKAELYDTKVEVERMKEFIQEIKSATK